MSLPNIGRGRRGRTAFFSILGFGMAALCTGIVHSQQPAPTPDKDAVREHVLKARALADGELIRFFNRRCLVEPAYRTTIAQSNQAPAPMDPVKVMDNLYFLGQNGVSSWALQTSEGFVVFDTLNNPDEAKKYIEGGMVKLGLDPAKIKYIVVTHEHGDHFGGAVYLKEKFGAHIMASKIAWDAMARTAAAPPRQAASDAPARSGAPPDWAKLVPPHDMDITDGQKFAVGDATLTFYLTPGHAAGVVSTIFRATDHGVAHVVGLHGGLGSINDPANRVTHVEQLKRWRSIAQAAGVDTLVGNHQTQDGAVENLELVKIRQGDDPNPFTLGKEGYLRYVDINIECTYANMARSGQKIQ